MSNFPQGVVVFFRILTADGSMARSVHLKGRDVQVGTFHLAHKEDYVVLDEEGQFLGCYPREFVAAIMPIETIGPADAGNPPNLTRN